MKYVRLGATGLQVSNLCLGMMSHGTPTWRPWVLEETEAVPFVRAAVEAGINFFREMMPLCRNEGIGMIPWSPLARGNLTRRPQEREATPRGAHEAATNALCDVPWRADVVNVVCDVAEARGVPPAQVALAWVASRPGVTSPIVGATKPHHLEDALAAIELTLEADEVARLEAPYGARPMGSSAP